MKLVMTLNVTDEFTYSYNINICFEAESIEAAHEELKTAFQNTRIGNVVFKGHTIDITCLIGGFDSFLEHGAHVFKPPLIQSLDDWFNSNCTQK